MGRKPVCTDAEFLAAYNTCATQQDIAVALECSLPSVYVYERKLGLKPKRSTERLARTLAIFNAYKGRKTIRDLSAEFSLLPNTVRYHLDLGVLDYWRKNPPAFPLPRKQREIKLVHALVDNPELFDDAEALSETTGVSVGYVRSYLEYAFDKMSAKKSKPKPEVSGRRAKR